MLRRLLACLVALAIALPSAAVTAGVPKATADCECPTGKHDCDDKAKACDCGLACTMRVAVVDQAVAPATLPAVSPAFAALLPTARSTPLTSALPDAPFRPPRLPIPT